MAHFLRAKGVRTVPSISLFDSSNFSGSLAYPSLTLTSLRGEACLIQEINFSDKYVLTGKSDFPAS